MRLRHRRAHLLAWGALALLLPAVLAAALALRLSAPAPDAPVRIAAP
jgi:hypothetical protein